MPPALPRPARALLLPAVGRRVGRRIGIRSSRNRSRGRRRLAPLITRDPYLAYSAAIVPIAALVLVISREPTSLIALGILALVFVGAQAILGRVPGRLRPLTPLGWSFLRLALALIFVAGIVELSGGPGGPMDALFLPVVVAAAALGPVQAGGDGAGGSVLYTAPGEMRPGAGARLA